MKINHEFLPIRHASHLEVASSPPPTAHAAKISPHEIQCQDGEITIVIQKVDPLAFVVAESLGIACEVESKHDSLHRVGIQGGGLSL